MTLTTVIKGDGVVLPDKICQKTTKTPHRCLILIAAKTYNYTRSSAAPDSIIIPSTEIITTTYCSKFEIKSLNHEMYVKVSDLVSLKDKYSCILGVIVLLCNNAMNLLIRAPDKREY